MTSTKDTRILTCLGSGYWIYVLWRNPVSKPSQRVPKWPQNRWFFVRVLHIFLSFFIDHFVSRPGRLLFSLVVQGNNNKPKQGKATQEETQDQTCPRQDQTHRSSCHHARPKNTRNSFRLHAGAQIVPEKNHRLERWGGQAIFNKVFSRFSFGAQNRPKNRSQQIMDVFSDYIWGPKHNSKRSKKRHFAIIYSVSTRSTVSKRDPILISCWEPALTKKRQQGMSLKKDRVRRWKMATSSIPDRRHRAWALYNNVFPALWTITRNLCFEPFSWTLVRTPQAQGQ